MTKRQEEIIEAILISFDISWCNNYTTKDLGTEKQFTFKDETYTMFPDDFNVIIDLITFFNGGKIIKKYIPNDFHQIAKKYCDGELYLYEASQQCGCAEDTFKNRLKQFGYIKQKNKLYGPRYDLPNFDYVASKYKSGEYSMLECGRLLGISADTFKRYLKSKEELQHEQ